jgi:putative FmdB family regulatory protein
MPIYEYICLDCGERFELLRSMKDADAPITCRGCEGQHTSRLLSLFNASSGGRVVAGGASGCASCSSGACATCGQSR